MEFIILAVLIIFVAAHYLPEFIKQRTLDSPLETVTEFHRGMSALGLSVFKGMAEEQGSSIYSSIYNTASPNRRRQGERYGPESYDPDADFIPYPRNRARTLMKTRQQRVLFVLFLLMLGTGIPCLTGSLRWLLYIHVALLVLSSIYVFLIIFTANPD